MLTNSSYSLKLFDCHDFAMQKETHDEIFGARRAEAVLDIQTHSYM